MVEEPEVDTVALVPVDEPDVVVIVEGSIVVPGASLTGGGRVRGGGEVAVEEEESVVEGLEGGSVVVGDEIEVVVDEKVGDGFADEEGLGSTVGVEEDGGVDISSVAAVVEEKVVGTSGTVVEVSDPVFDGRLTVSVVLVATAEEDEDGGREAEVGVSELIECRLPSYGTKTTSSNQQHGHSLSNEKEG